MTIAIDSLRPASGGAALFQGIEHGAQTSFFVVTSKPGHGAPKHRHPYEEIFVVLEGEIEVIVDGGLEMVSGGSIRNCSLSAAFQAADDDGVIGMRHLVRAVALEYGKQGRLTLEADFGMFHEVIKVGARANGH